jgi:heavy metal translocating P-type ATPase
VSARSYARAAALPIATLLFIIAGAVIRFAGGDPELGLATWTVGLLLTGAPLVWRTARGLLVGRFAADVVAMLAVLGAVALGQPLAGLVIVLRQTGGETLERYAHARASDAVRELEESAPHLAHRIAPDRIEDVAAADVLVGDRLLVRPGEMLPCDALVLDGASHVDVSRLTGEPLPLHARAGVRLMSGTLNDEGPLTLRALALASESQYARIVDLVRSAQESKAPLQRVADRYAVWFTPLTLFVCLIAFLFSGDWTRVLAVLVVATPCPLILATPVAILGGINRAARRDIIIRHGTALEQLGSVTAAVFDKTGTLTIGRPRVSEIICAPGTTREAVLRLAAGAETGSGHLLARSVVDAAAELGLDVPLASNVAEGPGRGVTGTVEGKLVVVGARSYVLEHSAPCDATLAKWAEQQSGLRAYVAIDSEVVGIIEFADQIRTGVADFFTELRALGVARILLVSGDHAGNTLDVARALAITDVYGDVLPADKARIVADLMRSGESVIMVGDGTNDAPALSTATVGIALAGSGGGISAEAADVVILADEPRRVAEAIKIGKRTVHIARQSIGVGLGLSALAMVAASLGMVPPTFGALLQEAIDVAVIVNALRTARGA